MKKIIRLDHQDLESYAGDTLLEWLKEIEAIKDGYTKKTGTLIIEFVED